MSSYRKVLLLLAVSLLLYSGVVAAQPRPKDDQAERTDLSKVEPPIPFQAGTELWVNTDVSEEPAYRCIATGDINGDGILDVVVGDYGSPYNIYVVDGSNGATLWSTSHYSDDVRAVAIGDVDGDGGLDVVAAWDGVGMFCVYDGATGTLLDAQNTLGGDVCSKAIAVGDVNGDGDAEVAVGTEGYTLELWDWQAGGMVLQWNVSFGNRVRPVAMGEFDGDAGLDVVAASDDLTVMAYDGDTNTQLWAAPYSFNDWPCYEFAIGDLNGDGYDDVVGGEYTGMVFALNGNTGAELWSYNATDNACSVYVGDLDGDGDLDVAAGDYDDYIYGLDGQAGTELWTPYQGTGGASYWMLDVVVGDFDNDGLNEIAGVSDDYNLYIVNGDDGTLFDSYAATDDLECADKGDFNNDGVDDVVFGGGSLIAYGFPANGRVLAGSITFTPASPQPPGTTVTIEADIRNTGAVDILCDVEFYYDGNLIGTLSSVNVPAFSDVHVSMDWDTTGVPPGAYTVEVRLTNIAPSDWDPADNSETAPYTLQAIPEFLFLMLAALASAMVAVLAARRS